MAERAQISVTGVVQGVGFRPFVHGLAGRLGIKGYITNTADGVLIDAEGDALAEFLIRLTSEAPPLARIAQLSSEPLPVHGYRDFTIRGSVDSPRAFTLLSPDVSLCADCRRELLDPADRRFQYPFINCTNCGPRYSITRSVPYDRPNTTMAAFTMCPDCSSEYLDPADRRFHAQPNACPVCGPTLQFIVQGTKYAVQGTPMEQCISVMRQGGIVAVKGLGGFHIACDAANDSAVATLRERKRGSNKPFAVMARDVAAVRAFCRLSDEEEKLLLSHQRPIVLLPKSVSPVQPLSGAISPGSSTIGCMLPYTPLHELLFRREGNAFRALVMTSGNLSEEPIVHTNEEAIRKLSAIVDGFLTHDRDIFMRVDDSVVRFAEWAMRNESKPHGNSEPRAPSSALMFIRRARGYAPEAIALRDNGPEVLGCGADLKNTFTLTKGSFAIPSQHIGDMENYETLRFYEECLSNLRQVYRIDPIALAHDLHPGYLSTRWALETGAGAMGHGTGMPLPAYAIQHHYAHIGSVMAEHDLSGPVIGVAFDGTGYGTDGNLWGGEFLIAGIDAFTRAGQLKYVPLPGGESAIREPWRTAISYVADAFGPEADDYLKRAGFLERHGKDAVEQVMKVAASRELSPLSSGAGRLFDAVSAMLGVCPVNTFEGEAAMALESLVQEGVDGEYPVVYKEENGYTVVDFADTVRALLIDLSKSMPVPVMAAQFHNTVASVIRTMVQRLHRKTGIRDIALSGGTFQNQYLLTRVLPLLNSDGLRAFTNTRMPPNDACISLGQAYLVRGRLKQRDLQEHPTGS